MRQTLFALFLAAAVIYVSGAATGHSAKEHPKHSAKELVGAVSKKCAAEHKVSAEHAKLAFNQEIPKEENEKCYLECVYTGVGVLHEGAFSLEGSKKLVGLRFHDHKESETATHLIDTCAKEIKKKDGEKCSLGRAVRECFVHHGKQVNFSPSA